MAQRNNPARRIPDNPLAGIIRAINQQSRYSARRRSGVPTVTTSFADQTEAALMAAEGDQLAQQFAAPVAVPTEAQLAALQAAEVMAFQLDVAEAAPVAASQAFETLAATLVTDDTGAATFTYGPYASAPVVTVTAVAGVAVVATVETADGTAATVRAFGLSGARQAGVTVHVSAFVVDPSQ
ncbi:hypothetical protein SEA_XKCD426_29 [Streptomyces phage Xkcd426]|nr:hypothetical protein SEA_XKCD426_29 [Streptomyces phage Xkcd426]